MSHEPAWVRLAQADRRDGRLWAFIVAVVSFAIILATCFGIQQRTKRDAVHRQRFMQECQAEGHSRFCCELLRKGTPCPQ